MLSAEDAVALYSLLQRSDVQCWIMGGWGVDALLGRVTRTHKDLDILVFRRDLAALDHVFRERLFWRKLVWDNENRRVEEDGQIWPTAFVQADPQGRELDVHVLDLGPASEVVVLSNVPWRFGAGSLDGRGTIAGTPVACISATTQIRMHEGYALTPVHVRDVEALRGLL